MDRDKLRRNIRRLIFATPTLSRAVMAGNFRSAFKGRGMDFDGLREYDPGDDALRMDWNATARLARPFVKTWRDDRSLAVYLIIDETSSMDFGAGRSKRETAALAASLLAYACVQNGASVGALFYGGAGFEHLEPAQGERAAFALVERIASGSPKAGAPKAGALKAGLRLERAGSDQKRADLDLGGALDSAMTHLKRRSLVVVLSDFLSSAWERSLALLARRHDAAIIRVHDELDDGPPAGHFSLRAMDSESGRHYLVSARSASYRAGRGAEASARRLQLLAAAQAARVPLLELDSKSDPAQAMVAFFGRRRPV